MSRHFYFGDYCNKPRLCISNNIFNFFLGIKSSISYTIEDLRSVFPVPYERFFPESSDFCESGVFFDLDPPTLIFRKMPMECIQFVKSYHVNISFDISNREYMTPYIKMHPPVYKSWFILYRTCRHRKFETFNFSLTLYFHWKQLSESLNSIKHTNR